MQHDIAECLGVLSKFLSINKKVRKNIIYKIFFQNLHDAAPYRTKEKL